MNILTNITRMPSDPKIIETGRSSAHPIDTLSRGLAWFGICLGTLELLAPRRIGRALGVESPTAYALIRFFGAREIAAGVVTLSTEKKLGLWSRVAGDVMDIAALTAALMPYNRRRQNVGPALIAVLGVTALDLFAAGQVTQRSRRKGEAKNYSGRTGFPNGTALSRNRANIAASTRQVEPAATSHRH
ncbi:MAG: DUF4267 domain-containing protein [Proteobacteria bacterium]|nr:DUF4267 domain-containing protein [Pseudomonadota bacterium]